jgi:hypothetical protein
MSGAGISAKILGEITTANKEGLAKIGVTPFQKPF